MLQRVSFLREGGWLRALPVDSIGSVADESVESKNK